MAKNKENKQFNQFKSTQNMVEFFELLLESAKKDEELWSEIETKKNNKKIK